MNNSSDLPEGNYSSDDMFHRQEVQLAFRNRGLPAEALQFPITPTGMHYLLNHFDIPIVDEGTWKLEIGGLVRKPLELDLDNIRQRPTVTLPVTMECAGNGRAFISPRPINQPWMLDAVSTAEWTGTPLKGLLSEAGMLDDGCEVLFTGLDRGIQAEEDQYYQRSLTIDEATADQVLVAYNMNGAALEPQHGFPLRLIVPDWYGMTNVKWLHKIEVIKEPFNGVQMQFYREISGDGDAGSAIETMKVRAVITPPGLNAFPSLERHMNAGPTTLTGRAWAGRNSVSKVEVSTDDGVSWSPASLDDPVGAHAWCGWSFDWDAPAGRHTICARATDSQGNQQPSEPIWNVYGVVNNSISRLEVIVE